MPPRLATLVKVAWYDTRRTDPRPASSGRSLDAVADLPTRFGRFQIVAFWNNRDGKEHVAMVHGDVMGADDVPTRLHSECLT